MWRNKELKNNGTLEELYSYFENVLTEPVNYKLNKDYSDNIRETAYEKETGCEPIWIAKTQGYLPAKPSRLQVYFLSQVITPNHEVY